MDKTDLKAKKLKARKAAAERESDITGDVSESTDSQTTRAMQKGRFVLGMLLAASGLGSMLIVAAGALQTAGMNGRLSLPAVAIFMVMGLMLLGGGFGVMATSAGTFDDDEFCRLMEESVAERESRTSQSMVSELPAFRSNEQDPEQPVRQNVEQTVA